MANVTRASPCLGFNHFAVLTIHPHPWMRLPTDRYWQRQHCYFNWIVEHCFYCSWWPRYCFCIPGRGDSLRSSICWTESWSRFHQGTVQVNWMALHFFFSSFFFSGVDSQEDPSRISQVLPCLSLTNSAVLTQYLRISNALTSHQQTEGDNVTLAPPSADGDVNFG